ncbi:hypothetical protein GGS26DRAFT_584802 [Hypomontagnella submonticulosa]|nr:hypothetical protein GGS26DRAFT_584802 [Hypomontagnella submonticulosa]
MSPFNGKQIFNNARSKLKHSQRLKGIVRALSIRRLKQYRGTGADSGDALDNDDQSSIGNPVSLAGPSTTMINSSTDTTASASEAKLKDVVTLSPGGSTKDKAMGLLDLPQELFDSITSYLGHAHIAVLALVNKELMARFMNSCAKLEIIEPSEPQYRVLNAFIKKADSSKTKVRGTFLSLVDYDLEDVVYCYKCKKLHDPFVSFRDRAYAPHKATRCTDWSMEHHMPSRATRKMLRSITKRRIHGAEYRHLLQQVNNTTTTYQKGIMVQVSLRMRYRDDDLILRRQQVVSSIDKSALALWLFGQQLQHPAPSGTAALQLPKVYLMCNHQSWGAVFSPLIQQLVDTLCKESDTDDDDASQHTPVCFDSEAIDVSKQEGHMIHERLKWLSSEDKPNPMDMPALLGDVLGCNKCTTDFSLDVAPLPEPFGWGFVLTTWLDLGRLDFCTKWDSHRDARPGREYKRQHGHGDICEKFEGLASRRDHRPRIAALDLERMRNYGWGERAAAGRDRYVAWTSAHSCNPATGWIEDPDPLEEEDY